MLRGNQAHIITPCALYAATSGAASCCVKRAYNENYCFSDRTEKQQFSLQYFVFNTIEFH